MILVEPPSLEAFKRQVDVKLKDTFSDGLGIRFMVGFDLKRSFPT